MKKIIFLLLLIISYTFAINTDSNIEPPKVKAEQSVHKDFIDHKEFTTFCSQENLKNNTLREYLNNFISFLKSLSVQNILFAIVAFLLYLIITGFFMTIGFGAFWWVIPASDLYHNNLLAVIGYFIDWYITLIKLFFAIFGIYIVNFGSVVTTIANIIGIIFISIIAIKIIINIFGNDKNNKKNKQKMLKSIFGLFYKLALVDGKFSKEEESYLKQYLYQFTQNLDLDETMASNLESFQKNFENKSVIYYLSTFQESLKQEIHSKNKRIEIYKHLLNDLVNFAAIDGIDEKKQKTLYKIANQLNLIEILDNLFNKQNNTNNHNIKSNEKDPYDILSVSKDDSFETIKKKYKQLVQKYHPDKLSSKGLDEEFIKFAENKIKEINEAYNFIKENHNK